MGILGKPRSLTVHVATAFAVVFGALAVALITFSYFNSRALVLDAAEKLADARLSLLATQTEGEFGRIENAVRAIAANPAAKSLDAIDHDRQLMIGYFESLPDLDGFYVGYPNGEFFHLVSTLRSSTWRETLSAPADASYATRLIRVGRAGPAVSAWSFYDTNGERLGSSISTIGGYDPRTRPWYLNAGDAAGVTWTPAYIFATTKKIGLTMSMAAADKRGIVVGADVTLAHLGEMLDRQKISPSSRVMLFDGRGRLIAFSGMDESAFANSVLPSGKVLGPMIGKDADDALKVVSHAVERNASGAVFGLAIVNRDSGYVVSSKPVNVSDRQLFAAMGVPAEELMTDVTRHNRRALIVSAIIALASLPIIYFVSQLIARPLKELSVEAKKLKAFDVDHPITTRSLIREVQRLANAMRSAKAGIATAGLYVPKELVRQVLRSGIAPSLGGEERDLTIMFLDLDGFTSLAERSSPHDTMIMLSDFFSLASDEISRAGGCVDKFIGDGIMAFWNAPALVEDHAAKACECALSIEARMVESNRHRIDNGLPPLHVRIGIHSGTAVVGNVGSADRLAYTAIGDAVNIAARLETLNKQFASSILMSGEVARRVRERFEIIAKGETALKGRSGRVPIYELRDRLARAHLAPTSSPLGARSTSVSAA